MTDRIPSSLKWLVTKRSRLAGEIKKAEVKLADRIQRVQTHALVHIELLKTDLDLIDRTIRLHEIQLDPEFIPPISTQTAGRKFKHGALTRAIFACLRQANNEALSTSQIALYVASYKAGPISNQDFAEIRYSVRKRLMAISGEGKIECVARARTSLEGYWRLKDWAAPSPIGRRKRIPL